ncbi:TniB family NTP-binding protein [Oerskovia sp. NPDC056781]|jgi:hypothetical protein|uniref:AAA+ ATPase domain-containing protein n=1 Tax=Oerskovia enterophila TaxID=43678 RepID=A0A163QKE8_9CELL|nr:TniB family NTP-binding protein [Oerskovia enterophila]KZM34252.1 hypothetical protein OJAG_30840 [Oerskovia enterophila]
MDAAAWHRQARYEPPTPPPVHTRRELRTMPARALEQYIRHRRRWIQGVVFPWAAGGQARERLTELVENNEFRPPGAKNVIAVTAAFTAGKSTLVRAWAQDFYREILAAKISDPQPPTWRPRHGVEADHIPVGWIDLGSAGKIRMLNAQVLDFFGYPTTGRIPDLTVRFSKVVDNHQVKILVVDDINLLQLGHQDARQVLDHLKHINTVLGQQGGSLVLVGQQSDKSLVFTDPQLAGRLQIIRLHPFAVDTSRDVADWQEFLSGIEDHLLPYLPAARPGLLAGTHAPRIWRRTQGFISDSAELLKGAAHLAAVDGSWTITSAHLEAVQLSQRATQAEQTAPRPRSARVAVKASS